MMSQVRSASWSSGQSFWLLITRSRVRFPALQWGFFLVGERIPVVTMVWVVSRIRFKVETSLTRSHTSIKSWLNPRQRSPRWRGPHHERASTSAHRAPNTLIADYGREKKKFRSAHIITIRQSVLFQSKFSTECHLVLHLSISNTFSFP